MTIILGLFAGVILACILAIPFFPATDEFEAEKMLRE